VQDEPVNEDGEAESEEEQEEEAAAGDHDWATAMTTLWMRVV
jgi:hypothetical protein